VGKKDVIRIDGVVTQVLPGTMFRVALRKHFIRISVGDKVALEMSPYDLNKARITYRY